MWQGQVQLPHLKTEVSVRFEPATCMQSLFYQLIFAKFAWHTLDRYKCRKDCFGRLVSLRYSIDQLILQVEIIS